MSPREKARELITNFTVYEWDELEGFIPDDHKTHINVIRVCDEVLKCIRYHGEDIGYMYSLEYWTKVKIEVKSFF